MLRRNCNSESLSTHFFKKLLWQLFRSSSEQERALVRICEASSKGVPLTDYPLWATNPADVSTDLTRNDRVFNAALSNTISATSIMNHTLQFESARSYNRNGSDSASFLTQSVLIFFSARYVTMGEVQPPLLGMHHRWYSMMFY